MQIRVSWRSLFAELRNSLKRYTRSIGCMIIGKSYFSFFCSFVCLSVWLLFWHISRPFVCSTVHMFNCLAVCLSVSMFKCLSICPEFFCYRLFVSSFVCSSERERETGTETGTRDWDRLSGKSWDWDWLRLRLPDWDWPRLAETGRDWSRLAEIGWLRSTDWPND